MTTLAKLQEEYERLEMLCDRFEWSDIEHHADGILTPLGEAVDEGLVPDAEYESFRKALRDVEKSLSAAYKTIAAKLIALEDEIEDLDG